MSAAVEVIGFVIEAMRNKVSRSIGSLASTSRQPIPAAWITLPARQTSVAAPASSPALTIAPMAVEIGSFSVISAPLTLPTPKDNLITDESSQTISFVAQSNYRIDPRSAQGGYKTRDDSH